MIPQTIEDFIWICLVGAVSIILWGIKTELKGIREDLKTERQARELLAIEIAKIKTRCLIHHGPYQEDS